ncbi:hypothetical protein [Mycobacteroides abscessus]|nr:hypothetical protein [Mycobacteroides abscessus]
MSDQYTVTPVVGGWRVIDTATDRFVSRRYLAAEAATAHCQHLNAVPR